MADAGCNKMKKLIKPMLYLAIVAFCLLGVMLHCQSNFFQEYETALFSLQWVVFLCIAFWCGLFLLLTFSLKDLPLIGILTISIVMFCVSNAASRSAEDAIIFLVGVALGKGTRFALMEDGRWKMEDGENNLESGKTSEFRIFLVGLVGLLAFASWWHLDLPGTYHGSRWMGLWNNPNIYGMLMGAGVILTAGLLADRSWQMLDGGGEKWKVKSGKRKLLFAAIKSVI
ncbi:MAG: hypothetical protein WCF18_14995, partial [Chthoniobacteraceae bacterium]